MPEPPTWPPPPNLPAPLSAHDDFLIACVRNSTPKPPLSRLSLAKSLREETELDLRVCWAFVNNFCDRHAILTGDLWARGAWTEFLPKLFGIAIIVIWAGMDFLLQRRYDAATAFSDKIAIKSEQSHVEFIVMCALVVISGGGALILKRWRNKKLYELATVARAKFA
jgi:hypothetical protein